MYEHKNGVTFRKVNQDDLSDLFILKQESWWGTHGAPIINMDDQQRWYDNLDDKTLVMIAEALNGSPIDFYIPVGVGIFSNINWIARTCDLSGSIYKEYRNSQLVKDAFECGLDFGFEMLNMHRIQAEVVEYNLAAQKLEIDHLGFTVEGRRREAVYKAGEYYDSIMLGITRFDWVATCAKRGYNSCNKNIDHEKFVRKSNRAMDLRKEPS